jgi:hypothetical protein
MEAVMCCTPAFSDLSRLAQAGNAYPIAIFRVPDEALLLSIGMMALLAMSLLVRDRRPERAALNARMKVLQMSFFLIFSMFQESGTPLSGRNGHDEEGDASRKGGSDPASGHTSGNHFLACGRSKYCT